MTTPGTGGLPPRRPDQMRSFQAPSIAPGASAGVIRARIVIVGGTSGGVFVYSGTPALGNLIGSLAGTGTTVDPFGNPVLGGGLAIYGAASQAVTLTEPGSLSQLQFLTGSGFEATPANLSAAPSGSGPSEIMLMVLSGPKGSTPGATDWVQVAMESAPQGGGAGAGGFLLYITTGGIAQTRLSWNANGVQIPLLQNTTITGSLINGITPGTFGLSSPGATAGAPPTGTATQASSFAAGSPALSYLTAFASTYNTTVAAVSAIVNGLAGWGV